MARGFSLTCKGSINRPRFSSRITVKLEKIRARSCFSVNRESRCQTPSEWTWKSAEQRSKTSVATAIGPWFCGRSLSGKTNPKNLNKAIQGRGRVSLHSIDTKSKTLENIIDRKVTDRQTDHMSVGYRFYEKIDRQAKEKKMTKRERYKIELQ